AQQEIDEAAGPPRDAETRSQPAHLSRADQSPAAPGNLANLDRAGHGRPAAPADVSERYCGHRVPPTVQRCRLHDGIGIPLRRIHHPAVGLKSAFFWLAGLECPPILKTVLLFNIMDRSRL